MGIAISAKSAVGAMGIAISAKSTVGAMGIAVGARKHGRAAMGAVYRKRKRRTGIEREERACRHQGIGKGLHRHRFGAAPRSSGIVASVS
jgi:hypothetical protein